MDLTAFTTALEGRLGIPSTDNFFDSTRKTRLINEAIRAISEEQDWDYLRDEHTFSTAADDSTYDLPADYYRLDSLFLDGIEWPKCSIRDLRGDENFRGWTEHDGSLVISPTPSSIVDAELIYYKTETALATGTDTPALPTRWHDLVVEFAAHLGNREKGPHRIRVRFGAGI